MCPHLPQRRPPRIAVGRRAFMTEKIEAIAVGVRMLPRGKQFKPAMSRDSWVAAFLAVRADVGRCDNPDRRSFLLSALRARPPHKSRSLPVALFFAQRQTVGFISRLGRFISRLGQERFPVRPATGIGSQALDRVCDFPGRTVPLEHKSRIFPWNREFGQRVSRRRRS
jgi:hypothetical protein